MSEMVERVALATCSSVPCICKHKSGFDGMPCLDRGRAGIAAMREPTDDMLPVIGADQMFGDGGLKEGWAMMIEAALTDWPTANQLAKGERAGNVPRERAGTRRSPEK